MLESCKRPYSTLPKQRSFFIDKKSTISTRQTSRSNAKSFIIKPKNIQSVQKPSQLHLISQSTPIEIYFNPEYRTNYFQKVIDTFFVNSNHDKQKDKTLQNNKDITSNKLSLRSRMKQWKKKDLIIEQFQIPKSNKFIRSSPKKSNISEFSEGKSMAIITDDNNSIQFQNPSSFNKDNQDESILINNDSNSFKSIKQFTNYSKLRPLTESNKRRIMARQKQSNTLPINQSFSVSLFFNQRDSPRQKMRKQTRKIIEQNAYFQQYAVYQDRKLKQKIRKYLQINGQINPLYQRQDKIRKKGIKSLWNYTKFQQTLQYPLMKSIKQMLSDQFIYGNNQLDKYIQIYPKTYYNKLFQNKNQELVDIIKAMTILIINNKGKVLISGGFNLQNLYKIDQKIYYLKDLGTSGVLQQIKIRDKVIKHFYEPIWKQNGPKGKWLVKPQFIAPQCLESYSNWDFGWIESQPEAVMASQIWSLGCMILQLLTIIPLNSNIRCRIKTKQNNFRRGYLSVNKKDNNSYIEELKRKQKFLPNILKRKIQSQLVNIPLEKSVLQLLRKMIVYDSKKRISPQNIMQWPF